MWSGRQRLGPRTESAPQSQWERVEGSWFTAQPAGPTTLLGIADLARARTTMSTDLSEDWDDEQYG